MKKTLVLAVALAAVMAVPSYCMARGDDSGILPAYDESRLTLDEAVNAINLAISTEEKMDEVRRKIYEWVKTPEEVRDMIEMAEEAHEADIQENLEIVRKIVEVACRTKTPGCATNWWKGDADTDGDGIINSEDNCAYDANPGQADNDLDEDGKVAGDGVGDACDNCVPVANEDQLDENGNEIGDVCEVDSDADGVRDMDDNCIYFPNSDQADINRNMKGDACEVVYNAMNSSNASMRVGGKEDTEAAGNGGGCRMTIAALPTPSNLGQAFFLALALAGLVLGRASRK